MVNSDRRLAIVVPATILATASVGAALYFSGRLRFMFRFPYVSCSLRRCIARVRPPQPPRLGAPNGGITVEPNSYPWVHRDNEFTEEKFGVTIADAYRWLEDPDCPRTAAFAESQGLFGAQILEKCDTRDRFKLLFTELYNTPKFGCPHEEGGRYYFRFNSGLQNQSCLFFTDGDFKDPKLFLDPNEWSEDGTVALGGTYFSHDGQLAAYSINDGGSDWRTIKVVRVLQSPEAAEIPYDALDDVLDFVKHSSVAWTHDNKGFFYARYDNTREAANGSMRRENAANKYHKLYYHTLGQPQSEDALIWKMDEEPDYMVSGHVTEDGRYLIIDQCPGCSPGNAVSYIDLQHVPKDNNGVMDFGNTASDRTVPLIKGIKNAYRFISNEGSVFTFLTDHNAPRWKLVKVDINRSMSWTTLIPEHEKNVIEWACAIDGDRLVVCCLQDCSNTVEMRRLSTGERLGEIDIPKFGSVLSFSGKMASSEIFLLLQSCNLPSTVYRYEADSNRMTVIHQTVIPGYNPSDFETEQIFVDSYDKKAKIPMFVTHKKGLKLNGRNPTLMTGYGGFGCSVLPSFSVSAVAFIMAYDGVHVSTNLRGGNEYGLEWRRAGNKENKQNVFDDFQTCAEYMIRQNYCSPETLAIRGGSNGGLLVAVCANQRPDLFGCVICEVGVLDMLRFHLFTIGHAWLPEFGDPEKPLEGSRQYPSLLLTTADQDDRVSSLHTFKFLAELQHVLCSGADSPQTNPLIVRVETRAGHGSGKSTASIIDEISDVTGFIAASLKAEWKLD